MANKSVFGSAKRGQTPVPATAVNEAGGRAFAFTDKHALAQFAATGTFNDTFYVSAEDQVTKVLELCAKIQDVNFLGKVALYSREKGYMKDMPALICAHLAARNIGGLAVLKKIFPRVIDNGKMLRNFIQIIRSGKVGRKSLGTAPQKLVQNWFASRKDDEIFRQSVGNDPSMRVVIKLARPRPATDERRALYGYLIGADRERLSQDASLKKGEWGFGYDPEKLPALVKEFEAFKAARTNGESTGDGLPKVPMEMLTGLDLTEKDWKALALTASWTQIRMNLNTFARHGVFKDSGVTKSLAAKLMDRDQILKSRVFPYQLMTAFLNVDTDIPVVLKNALQDAMEVAVENVPVVPGAVVVCPDVSGSMSSPVTGHRAGSTTAARCIDIAALVASVFLRKNPETRVLPFEQSVVTKLELNGRDSIMTNAQKLASIGGGGTNCSAPLHYINQKKMVPGLVVFVSDNESWVDTTRGGYRNTTGMLAEWEQIRAKNPSARLVCIDIQPNSTAQAPERKDILNIGGFSDSIFETISRFVQGDLSPEHWVGIIEEFKIE